MNSFFKSNDVDEEMNNISLLIDAAMENLNICRYSSLGELDGDTVKSGLYLTTLVMENVSERVSELGQVLRREVTA